jgi:lysophospholipase L1-like esterase
VRAKQPEVEFLFMTGAMLEPGMNYGWIQKGLSHPTPEVYKRARDEETKFYNALAALRDAEHFATLDMRDAWENYLQTCGRPRDFFQRDFIHSNDRGKQILGRILAAYFQPPQP